MTRPAHHRVACVRQRDRRASALLLGAVLTLLLAGCSGRACDGLARLQAEREQRRIEHQRLIEARTASTPEVGAADDRLHAFERKVHELEQSCDRS